MKTLKSNCAQEQNSDEKSVVHWDHFYLLDLAFAIATAAAESCNTLGELQGPGERPFVHVIRLRSRGSSLAADLSHWPRDHGSGRVHLGI
jgi:hypothetical protein